MKRRSLAASIVIVPLVALLTACGGEESSSPETSAAQGSASPPSASMDGHTSADVVFAQMMIPHHAQAIDMSETLLGKPGIDPRVRSLARDIRAAQQPEITQLSDWLRAWGVPVSASPGTGGDMGHAGHHSGMMSEQDLEALADAAGPDAERLFLAQMIRHHEGAVAMAQQEVEAGAHPQAVRMAKDIVASQQAEIVAMRELLSQRDAT